MQKRTKKFLYEFALDAIARIEKHIEGRSFNAFVREPMPHDATVLRLQFLGFALRDLSKKSGTEETKRFLALKSQKYNALAEDYHTVNYRKIWKTVTLELPILKRKLQSQIVRDAKKKKG